MLLFRLYCSVPPDVVPAVTRACALPLYVRLFLTVGAVTLAFAFWITAVIVLMDDAFQLDVSFTLYRIEYAPAFVAVG